jgi:hypothetical protein
MRTFSRKADLSLSTNAIVVMIIAIVILGLALTFTRTIFQKLGGQIGNLGEQSIEEPPSYDKPLTLTSTSLEVRKGQSKNMGVAVYNKFTENTACVDGTEPECKMKITVAMGECMGDTGEETGIQLVDEFDQPIIDLSGAPVLEGGIKNVGPTDYGNYNIGDLEPGYYGWITMLSPAPKNININEYSSFSTKVKISPGARPGDYACTILAIDAVVEDPTQGIISQGIVASQDLIITIK